MGKKRSLGDSNQENSGKGYSRRDGFSGEYTAGIAESPMREASVD